MSQIPAYERDPYQRRLGVRIVEAGQQDERPWVVLDDTILYPEGGGQPADRGWLDGVAVLDVQRVDGSVRLYLERALQQGTGQLELDWDRRFDHMQQHTGQHLLTAIAADRFGWPTSSFHLGAQRCDIELLAPVTALTPERLEALEERVAQEIRAASPVTSRRVTPEQFARSGARSRGLPAGHRGDVRLVQIEGVDECACGGTHLANTAQIECLKLLRVEPMRGGTRLSWIAGGRVRRLLQAHEDRAAELRELLGAGREDAISVMAGRLQRLRDAERRVKALERELVQALEHELLDGPGPVLERHFEGHGAGWLQLLARRLVPQLRRRVALLTARDADGAYFVLACGAEAAIELREVGGRIAELLDGRGGGASGIYQGKAGSLKGRDEALEELRTDLG